MKLSIIKYLSLATLLFTTSGIARSADSAGPSILSTGTCGKTATYTIYSDMSMVIDGTGSVYDYYIAQGGLGMEDGEGADPDSPSLAPRRAGATEDDGERWSTDTRDSYWTQVVKVEVKSGITHIGDYAFYGCDVLTDVHVGSNPASVTNYSFHEVDLSACTLWIPQACTDVYANDAVWGQFGQIVEPYSEGEAMVEVLPFALKANAEVALTLNSAAALTHIAFDVVLPSAFTSNGLCQIDAAMTESRFTTTSQGNTDGAVHVTIAGVDANTLVAGKYTLATLGLRYNAAILGSEVYGITIQNIELTAEDGTVQHADAYATEIYAGTSPKMAAAEGVAAYHGNYGGAAEMALLKASLPVRATVDLTEVSALAEDITTTPSDNVIVTSDKVAYGRTVANEWGSICLPFEVESDEDVQFYELTDVTSEALVFDAVSTVPAHTPAFFKAKGNSFCVSAVNDGTFAVDFASASQQVIQKDQRVSGWVMNGSYTDQTFDASSLQLYALVGNAVHKITETLNATAFRAWLQNDGTPLGARLRITEGSITGLELAEQEDGAKAVLRFDLNGRRLPSAYGQRLFINNGKVTLNK